MKKEMRLVIAHAIGLLFLHIGCIYLYFHVDITLSAILCGFIMYQIKILGITVGYHRLFTHRSFRTNRFISFLLAFAGTLAGQGPIKRWVLHHRGHHRHSDEVNDPHSPKDKGFVHAHIGWLFLTKTFDDKKFANQNLKLNRGEQFLDKNFTLVFMLQIPILFFLGGWSWVYTGFFLSTVASLHATFLVNSLCHIIGDRAHTTKDESRNNAFVALLTNGEGWHNNHHHNQSSARHGQTFWQIDISYLLIVILEKMKLVTHVNRS